MRQSVTYKDATHLKRKLSILKVFVCLKCDFAVAVSVHAEEHVLHVLQLTLQYKHTRYNYVQAILGNTFRPSDLLLSANHSSKRLFFKSIQIAT